MKYDKPEIKIEKFEFAEDLTAEILSINDPGFEEPIIDPFIEVQSFIFGTEK